MQKDLVALKSIARAFDARRARTTAAAIWNEARRQDTPAVWRAARVAEKRLRAAGLENVRIEKVPADGATSMTGWLMPPAWSVIAARLEIDARPRRLLAGHRAQPLTLALNSPSTPAGQWVAGTLWELPAAEKPALPPAARLRRHAAAAAGKFIVMREEVKPSIPMNLLAARLGCPAIISIHPGPALDAARYLNYSAPLDLKSRGVPVFSLTRRAGRELLAALRANPALRLRARASVRREAGSMPLVTGTLGEGDPALYICAHIDEIGAHDNASGCAVAIETLRALASLPPGTLRRQIRVYLGSEVRGQQWWFNERERPTSFLGGINLDMVGADPKREHGAMQVLTGFRHRPHFAARLIVECARMADKIAGPVDFALRANYASDALPGLTRHGGHVSLEEKPGPTYHTSDDTPQVLSPRILRWAGTAATLFLHRMATLETRDLLAWARKWQPDAGETDPAIRAARFAAELRSLRRAVPQRQVDPALRDPESFYAAGVSRRTGLWPDTADRLRLEALIASRTRAVLPRAAPVARGKTLVPCAAGNGLVSFEDHVTPAEVERLWQRLRLRPGWGVDGWISFLYNACDGKHTLDEIVASLRRVGVDVDPAQARKLILYLAERKMLRLRPVLKAGAIRAALRRAGVRRGATLMVHSSLSRFGYVEGGPATVVRALRDVLGPRGTLVVPTHSVSVLGAPPYDPRTSPATTGAIPEYFRKQPGVLRSPHPTHSVAALGPRAAELTAAHRPDLTPMSRAGFWGRLCDVAGDVLLLCPIRSATIFHVGEAWLDLPLRRMVTHAVDGQGRRKVYVLPNAPWHVDHFEKHLAAPLKRKGIMTVTPLGESEIYLAPARAMAEISVKDLGRHPEHCLGKEGACHCRFCAALRQGLARGWRAPRIDLWSPDD